MSDAALKQYNIRFIMTIFRRTIRYTDHNDRYVAVQFLSFCKRFRYQCAISDGIC